jgi:hypothetical protein
MTAFVAHADAARHCGKALRAHLNRWRFLAVPARNTIQAPITLLKVMAKPQRIANMIEHHRWWFARCWSEATTDHLQVQTYRLRWPQQNAAANARHINTFANQGATGQYL